MKSQQRKKIVRSKIHKSARVHHAQQEHVRSRVWMRMLVIFLSILFIAVCGYVLLYSPLTRITSIEINGITTLSENDIRKHVGEQLSGMVLSYIPRDHYVLIAAPTIETLLQENFHRIDTVVVTRKFPHTISVEITERESVLVWCRDAEKSHCFTMDRYGVLYAQADFASDEITQNNLVTIIDRSGRDVALYDRILQEKTLDHILAHSKFFQSQDIFETQRVVTMPSRISGELIIHTREGWDLWIDVMQPPKNVHRAIGTFFKKITFIPEQEKEDHDEDQVTKEDADPEGDTQEGQEEIDPLEPTHSARPRSDLLYVDFRVTEKVFYKFKETEKERIEREKIEADEEDNDAEDESDNSSDVGEAQGT